MHDRLQAILNEARAEVAAANTRDAVEALRVKYLGKKAEFTNLMKGLKDVPAADRPAVGKAINDTKSEIEAMIEAAAERGKKAADAYDISFPAQRRSFGSKHPLMQVTEEVCGIFKTLGFRVAEGSEIEDEWFNFDALNVPADHTSRDVTDTFYLDLPKREDYRRLLRCHTSPQQIRIMANEKPPLAVVSPGRVYRPDAVDASHLFMFHQIEGFAVQEDLSLAHLKGVLQKFAQEMFGSQTQIRFRPSYFPFTEPSAEVDVSCIICKGKGCPVCKRTGWLEVLGCGMIHPNVLKSAGIDSAKYRGFAFGMGVERIAMLRYRISDIRMLIENDVKFLEQFYEV